MKKLTLALAQNFTKLFELQRLPSSTFGMKLTNALQHHGAITLQKEGRGFHAVLTNPQFLESFLLHTYGCYDLNKWIEGVQHSSTRGELVGHGLSSKTKRIPIFKGLCVASLQPLAVLLNHIPFTLHTPPGGMMVLNYLEPFVLPPEVVVVIVENGENLKNAYRYRKLFDPNRSFIFVYRQHAHTWIGSIDNEMIHFGDIDLAGIAIYLHEIAPCIKHQRHRFFIYDEIDAMLEKGNKALYEKQWHKYQGLSSDMPYLQALIEKIHLARACIEQEWMV